MKLGIDFRPALFGGAGIGRATREICRALPRLLEPGEEAVLYGVAFRKPDPSLNLDSEFNAFDNMKVVQGRFPGRLLNLLSRLGIVCAERFTGELDLFLHTDFVYPPFLRTPGCVMIYDLLFMRASEGYNTAAFCRRMENRVRAAVARACGAVVPSRSVREDFERYFPEARLPVRVIPLAGDHLPPAKKPEGLPAPSPGGYFLSVGTLEPRKNRIRILEAFERVAGSLPGIRLVVAGRTGWMDEPFQERLRASKVRDAVLIYREIDDAGLSWLYQNALALVYPSLAEGFGIPVAEAMALGCPVVTSGRSALPEVAGEAALLVDPLDAAALAGALEKVAGDERVRESLGNAGKKRASELTWRGTAMKLLAFMRELHGARTDL